MSDYRKFNEEVLREVKQECKKYNYCAELRFNEIHIQTKFESWYFVPNECGIIKLMHGNTIGHISERFHKQFSRILDTFLNDFTSSFLEKCLIKIWFSIYTNTKRQNIQTMFSLLHLQRQAE